MSRDRHGDDPPAIRPNAQQAVEDYLAIYARLEGRLERQGVAALVLAASLNDVAEQLEMIEGTVVRAGTDLADALKETGVTVTRRTR